MFVRLFQGLTIIAEVLCKNVPEQIPPLVELFEPVLKRVYDTQRVVAAAMYAEFINQQCAGDLSLMNRLKNGLLAKLVDPSHCTLFDKMDGFVGYLAVLTGLFRTPSPHCPCLSRSHSQSSACCASRAWAM